MSAIIDKANDTCVIDPNINKLCHKFLLNILHSTERLGLFCSDELLRLEKYMSRVLLG